LEKQKALIYCAPKEKKMKAHLAVVLIALGVVIGTSGCGSTLPAVIQEAQLFETGVQVALETAEALWPGIVTLLPVAQQTVANAAYQDAVVTANGTLATLNDAITVAEDSGNPIANIAALTAAVSDALDQVLTVINQFKGNNPPAGLAALEARVASAKKNLKTLKRLHS
jgi:hypothetical protein